MYSKKSSYEGLYLFREIMRCGTFQKAAKEMGSTSANLSKKISQLEAELDISLFEGENDEQVPTAAGLYLYDRLDSVLWNLDAALQQARNIPSESSMKLNIGISDMIAGDVYRRLLQRFIKVHPEIKFTLSSPPTRDMQRRLSDQRLDAAITYSVGFADEPRLARLPLLRAKPCIYYNKQMDIGADADRIESFQNCTFICLNTDVAARNMLQELPFEPGRVIFAENLKTLYLYVNAGIACTILGPSQQLSEDLNISCVELSSLDYELGIDIVWEKTNDNPAIRLLTDTAREVF